MSGRDVGRRFWPAVLVSLAVVASLSASGVSAQTVDPQSLVGEWVGNWSSPTEASFQGTHSVTITKVEGNQVHGHLDRIGSGRLVSTAHADFVGTLEGDKLAFAVPGNSIELTVSGTTMRGTGFESVRLNISMTKRK